MVVVCHTAPHLCLKAEGIRVRRVPFKAGIVR